MSLIEELRPLVSLCQGCGLIPYTMELDRNKTPISYHFSFSWKNWITWWSLSTMILQIIVPFLVGRFMTDVMADIYSGEGVPITITLAGAFAALSILIQVGLCRWIVFRRFRSLRVAFNIVQNIQLNYGQYYNRHRNSITIRFIIGFTLIVSIVIGDIFLHFFR